MIVEEIMNKEVKTIEETSSIKDAVVLMNKYRVSCLIVLANKKMVGIITERDILKAFEDNNDLDKTPVKEVMTEKVFFVSPDMDVTDAAEIMVKEKIKKLPVLYSGMLVGIITAMDIVASEPKLMKQISTIMFLGKKHSMAG